MDRTRRYNRGFRQALIATAAAVSVLVPLSARADTAPVSRSQAISMSANSFAGAMLAGQMAANDNDLENAIAFFQRALQFDPEDAGVNSQLFVALLFDGKLDAAAAQATNVAGNTQLAPLAALATGLDDLNRGKYAEAIAHLDQYSDSDIDKLAAALLKAWALAGEDKTDDALAALDALKGPDWYKVFVNYTAGEIAYYSGATDKARTYFNNALFDQTGVRSAPDTLLRIVNALAAIEQKAGNKQKALDTLSVAETYGLNEAVLDPIRQQIEAGTPLDGKAGSIAGGAASGLFILAAALNQGSPDDLVSLYLGLAAALAPDDPGILFLRGELATNAKKPEQALAFFSQVAPDAPQYRLAELQSGLALADLGRTDEALTKLEDLIAAEPDDRRGYMALSALYSTEKNYEKMAEVLDKAVDMIGSVPEPDDWNIFYRRGIAYERLHEWDKAEPNFFKALELFPDQPQVLNYLGYSWIDQGINLDKGLDMIKKAVDQRPDDGYIVDSLGWAYFRLGRFNDAMQELEHAVQLDSGDPTINDHLGDAYWRNGRKLEAIYQWNKALTDNPEPEDVSAIRDKIAHGLPDLPPEATEKQAATGGDKAKETDASGSGAATPADQK